MVEVAKPDYLSLVNKGDVYHLVVVDCRSLVVNSVAMENWIGCECADSQKIWSCFTG